MTARESRVLRAAERFRTERDGISTSHEFSFGDHYAPDRIRLGPLVAHNVETLAPGAGYAPHVHRDVEIVTWLFEGTLEHDDDFGHVARIEAPSVQRLTAARGVRHTEVNASRGTGGTTVRFVQLWLDCPEAVEPSHASARIDRGRLGQHLVALAASHDTGVIDPAVSLHTPGVTLFAGSIGAGRTWSLPDAEVLHLYVIDGDVRLQAGESARVGDSIVVRQGHAEHVTALADSQLLVLSLDLSTSRRRW